jgi:hypothetical protein
MAANLKITVMSIPISLTSAPLIIYRRKELSIYLNPLLL